MKKSLGYKLLLISSLLLITSCDGFGKNSDGSSSSSIISSSSKVTNPVEARKAWTPSMSTLEKADSLIEVMTLEQKVGQMLQIERNSASNLDVKTKYLGSIFSGGGSSPGGIREWVNMYNTYQFNAMANDLQVPILYGIDAVHGNNNVYGATMFPHNIGLGAANDPELMYKIGQATASEMTNLGHNWAFAPAVSSVQDIRWGRSYESYSEDPEIVNNLAIPLIQGLQDNGVAATAKHYLLDGFTQGGHDQGSSVASEEVVRDLFLSSYKEAVDAGVKTVMISYSSLNGKKMHENKYWVTDVLKEELGFNGIVVSDYNAVLQLSGSNLRAKLANSINAGIDMIMHANDSVQWQDVFNEIILANKYGTISTERINDAVRRILMVKIEMNVFDEYLVGQPANSQFRTATNLEIAREAVAKSLVLLKNDQDVLPLKKNQDILLLGPAMNSIGIQSGGWTISWQGSDSAKLTTGTTILQAFNEATEGHVYTNIADANKADVAVVVIGEKPYAEFNGDNSTLTLNSNTALSGNIAALEAAFDTGLPVVVIMVAGRPLLINDYIDQIDSFVMAWLPGTEAAGITDVLYGDKNFTGKLPVTWPKSISQAADSVIMEAYNGRVYNPNDYQFPFGYGLTYN
jgi:beta-glucosidase